MTVSGDPDAAPGPPIDRPHWLTSPNDIDPELRACLAEAYRVGQQLHLPVASTDVVYD